MSHIDNWRLYLFVGWLFKKDPFKVCYGSLGCFSSRYPYSNTLAILPRSPSVIGTKFLLVTRENDGKEELIQNDINDTIACGKFRHDRPTKMIIHGYIHTVDAAWVRKMVIELLKHVRTHLILVMRNSDLSLCEEHRNSSAV